tara:strand:+ start:433 stop:1671 length:1239 start_codon:yes stop_codon:yes gene_type:complete
MPSLNGINVKDAEFTAMQEKATALISKRSFVDNINFTSHLDIIKDKKTVQGLKEIFVKDRVQLFNYKSPFSQKIEENWFKTFYKQNERILKEFSNAQFTVFDRDDKDGFMMWFMKTIRDYFKISNKDSYNPADIWLIDKREVNRQIILKELEGPKGTQTVEELNQIMRKLYKDRKVVGLSLKLISGQQARYQEVNLDDKFFKAVENKKGEFDYKLLKVMFNLSTFGKGKSGGFTTQDTVLTLGLRGTEIAKFQVKSNQTSKLSNLKIEGTGKGDAARLGKAPLGLVAELSAGKPYRSKFINKALDEPKNKAEFDNKAKMFEKMYNEMVTNMKQRGIPLETKIMPKDFIKNFRIAFEGRTPWIANNKLLQLRFLHMISKFKKDEIHEYMTDLIFLCQKIGRSVFPFGPFGKLY